MAIKLKKLLPTVILCMAATFAAHAEKSRVVDIDFSSPEDYSFYLGNSGSTDFAENDGVFGKAKADKVYKISSSSPQHNNPFAQYTYEVRASEGGYIHLRVTLGAEDVNKAAFGLGGKVIFSSGGEEMQGFINGGVTPIMVKEGALSLFGSDTGVKLRNGQLYTVDCLLYSGSADGENSFDAFVNGVKVAEDEKPQVTVSANGKNYTDFKIIGFVDFRLNNTVVKGTAFTTYFDDFLVETGDEKEDFSVMGGLIPTGGISLSDDCFILRDEVSGKMSQDIISEFEKPEGAELTLTNILGKSLKKPTKRSWLTLKGSDISYYYKIEEESGGAGRNTYYYNDMSSPLAASKSAAGIGGRDEGDRSSLYSQTSQRTENLYFDGAQIGDKILAAELSFYVDDLNGSATIEAVSGNGIFARFLNLTSSGEIIVGAPATVVGTYEKGSWVNIAAAVRSDLSFDFYINGEKAATDGLKFSNNPNDTNTYDAVKRFKMTFAPSGAGEYNIYFDDLRFTITDEYPISTSAKSYLYSEKYEISGGKIIIDDPNTAAAELAEEIDADDEFLIDGIGENSPVGFKASLTEKLGLESLVHEIVMPLSLSGSFSDAADGKTAFSGKCENLSSYPKSALMLTAAYGADGALLSLDITKLSLGAKEEKEALSGEIKTSGAAEVRTWLISSFEDGILMGEPISK